MKLSNLRVMVTRPGHQGEALCRYIRKAGGEAFNFPVIEIVLLQTPAPSLNEFDWLIFVSPQAVYGAAPHLLFSAERTFKVAAIGLSTAEALSAKGCSVDFYPKEEWSSEGFLKSTEFQNMAGKKILLVKGEGGRDLLEHTLTARGGVVAGWIVYRRQLPRIDAMPFRPLLRDCKIDIIVCTSAEGIRNLVQLLSEEAPLVQIALLVVSERLKSYAQSLGFQRIFLARSAKNEAILEALLAVMRHM